MVVLAFRVPIVFPAVHGGVVAKIMALFGHPQPEGPYSTRDPKRDHDYANLPENHL